MRVPVAWLRESRDPGLAAEEIANALTMAGDKLERLFRTGVGDDAEFVVGRVLEAGRHPDADRLTVCVVDDGRTGRARSCAGRRTWQPARRWRWRGPARMPDGTELGEAKLRGVRSSGMILAEDEVGIGVDHDGIMVLAEDLAPGAALVAHLPIADEVLELEITAQPAGRRWASTASRDLHAVTGAAARRGPTEADAEPATECADSVDDCVAVEIDPEICLRFTRVFEDVTIAPSPLWLKQRLMAAGQRPISNVVDITNYVMLATASRCTHSTSTGVRGGRIVVRRAREGETMTTLDDVSAVSRRGIALVRDAEGPAGSGDHGRPDLGGSGDTTRC